MPIFHLPEHKKPDFVLERGQNQEKIAVSDTKMAILCSKWPEMGGFEGQKAYKNLDFVLEMPEIEGSEGLGAHGLCGRVANSAGNGCRLARDAGVGCWKWLPPDRELAGSWCGGWCGNWPGADAQTQNKNRKG